MGRWGCCAMVMLALVTNACASSETSVLEAEQSEDAATETLTAAETPAAETPTPATPPESSGDTVTVTHPEVPLSADVPVSWTDVDGSAWSIGQGNGTDVGQSLVAAEDIDAFYDTSGRGLQWPGIFIGTSDRLLEFERIDTESRGAFAADWAQYVARIEYDRSCEYGGVSDVSVGQGYGLHRVWTDCGEGVSTMADLWAADRASGRVVHALVVVAGSEEVDAARRILSSVRYAGEPGAMIDPS